MIGKILDGRYEIISKLGQGAFGTTYLAIDRKLPDKDQCVVKHFSPRTVNAYTLHHARRLFETEAKVLNRLGNNDCIPRLLAHFEEEENFYLVEEFVAGHDLSYEVNPHKIWSEEQVITLLKDILEALNVIHQHNVIHRDIKPSNLMRRQQDGKVVLIDFGAVKQINSQVVSAQGQELPTVVVGTPGYIPSEQSQGQPRLCSDVYAVGIIAIQALTGLNPTQIVRDSSTGEIIWRNQAKVSQQLADILDKMVKYDFRQRYENAAEVLQALKTVTPTHRLNKSIWWKAGIGLAVATAAIATILAFIFIQRNQNLEIYQNAVYGITIKYPQTWQKTVTPDRITGNLVKFISPKENNQDSYTENLNLIVQDLPETRRQLEQFNQFYLGEIQQSHQNLQITQNDETQLANQPARQVVYTFTEEGNKFQRLQVWTIKNNKAYIMTYTADAAKYSEYLPVVKTMISSLDIK
ncbi:serine/threonine-protein kinase [Anabaena azotica]|uniref:non-specific serine/threonine protein kinase n=1 Tax=Anabaena azotica FACHB-119 TaxID=947527 RepID=A0ABR8D2P1_9NOST|nr:serine/threonine-protein kinase [Anabaena azotica]MBD2501392.1 protein kinase [Anabaena azotica FACHB-119]